MPLPIAVEAAGRSVGKAKGAGAESRILAARRKQRFEGAHMLAHRAAIAEADTDAGAGDVGLAAHLYRRIVEPGAASPGGVKELARRRMKDEAEHRLALL